VSKLFVPEGSEPNRCHRAIDLSDLAHPEAQKSIDDPVGQIGAKAVEGAL
jgi:hypothetical protein